MLVLAFHKPVPASREATSTWRCAVHDLLSRKFGEWHAWLLPGRDGAEVPLTLTLTLTPPLPLPLTLTLTLTLTRSAGWPSRA